MRKKKRSKIKRLVNDNRAIAEVLGSILIMAIILPMVAIFGFMFTDMMTGQRSMMQSQIDAMQRFTDYLDDIYFNNTRSPIYESPAAIIPPDEPPDDDDERPFLEEEDDIVIIPTDDDDERPFLEEEDDIFIR